MHKDPHKQDSSWLGNVFIILAILALVLVKDALKCCNVLILDCVKTTLRVRAPGYEPVCEDGIVLAFAREASAVNCHQCYHTQLKQVYLYSSFIIGNRANYRQYNQANIEQAGLEDAPLGQ